MKEEKILLDENKLTFSALDGDSKKYEFELEFYKEIVPEESKKAVLPRHAQFVLKKKVTEGYWPRLTKDTKKVSSISLCSLNGKREINCLLAAYFLENGL